METQKNRDGSTLARAAAGFGALAVVLGAFGAHGLKGTLESQGGVSIWETASHYHLLHAVALYAMAVGAPRRRTAWFLMLLGTIVFSGSLYGLAVGGPRWLGPVTPLGGLAMVLGWGALALPAADKTESDPMT